MSNKLTFNEIIGGMQSGRYLEGDVFRNTAGFKITVYHNSLCWLAGISDYVSEKVTVDPDVYDVEWELVKGSGVLTLGQAVDKVSDGTEVMFDLGNSFKVIDSLEKLDDLIIDDCELPKLAESIIRVVERNETSQNSTGLSDTFQKLSNGFKEALENMGVSTNKDTQPMVDVSIEPVISKETVDAVANSLDRYSKKLSESEAWDIHHLRKVGGHSVAELSDHYGVSERMIYYVLDGTHWSTVQEEYDNTYANRMIIK